MSTGAIGGLKFSGPPNAMAAGNKDAQLRQQARMLSQYLSPEIGARNLGISVEEFKRLAGITDPQ